MKLIKKTKERFVPVSIELMQDASVLPSFLGYEPPTRWERFAAWVKQL
jgi:hypothetical protein